MGHKIADSAGFCFLAHDTEIKLQWNIQKYTCQTNKQKTTETMSSLVNKQFWKIIT